jgi:hypothetical protein
MKRFGLIGIIILVLFVSISIKLEWAMQTLSREDSIEHFDESAIVYEDHDSNSNLIAEASQKSISEELLVQGNHRYTIVLGAYDNAEIQKRSAEQWRKIGYDSIRLEGQAPFRIFSGVYYLRSEAEHLAEIAANKSGQQVTFMVIE